MNLSTLKVNDQAIISNFETELIPSKLLEVGLIPNVLVKVTAKAPYGGPILIELGNHKCRIAIRQEEAKLIPIEKLLCK